MRGKVNFINSSYDADIAELTEDQIINMATITVRYDDAVYPDGYDHRLTASDEGYIEPIWRFEKEIDQAVLQRFGLNSI